MDEPISVDELREIEARCDATTPGPWVSFVEGRDQVAGSSFIRTATQDIHLSADDYLGGGGHATADQDFVAHAKQDVPRLIAEIKRLRALLG